MNGSGGADTFLVSPDAPRVVVSGLGSVLNVGTVEKVSIDGLGGNDTITGGAVAALTKLDLDGGPGADTLNGGNGADVLRRRHRRGPGRRQRRRRHGGLGDGDDVFVWNPGDGNDVVEGDAGADTLGFTGDSDNEIFAASSNGTRLAFTRQIESVTWAPRMPAESRRSRWRRSRAPTPCG